MRPSSVPRIALPVVSLVALLACRSSVPEPVGDDTGGTPPVEGEALCQIDVECYGNVLDDPKVPCWLQAFEASGARMYEGPAGMELRGRSSLTFPKPQYAVELRDHTELPVWPGSAWRYLDDGSDAGTAWRQPQYDDGRWQSGPAPLGRTLDYLQTEVDVPAGDSVTTYFRATFSVGSPTDLQQLKIGIKAVDGAAVYLNGVEVLRENLRSDARYDTPAFDPRPDRSVWHEVKLPAALLTGSEEVLAVEVHRADPDFPALSFDLFLEASGEDRPMDLLGMGKDEDWLLNGQYVDRVLFRNRLAYDLFQSFGGKDRFATETRFCEMNLDGAYVGIYTLGERIKRDDARVDISRGDQPGDTFIVKNDDRGEGFLDNAVGYGFWQLEYPDPVDEPDAVAAVSAFLSGWADGVLGPDPADPNSGIFAWLDLGSAVDWVLINELMKNPDAYFLSVHLWRDQDGLLHFAPWDLDLSLGSYPYTDCGAEGWVPRTYWTHDGQERDLPFVQRMTEVPAFREALEARWRELRQGPLSEDAIAARIRHYDAILAPALEANLERWPIDDIVFSTVEVDDWLCPVDSYEEEHDLVVTFLSDRLAWMDDNLHQF